MSISDKQDTTWGTRLFSDGTMSPSVCGTAIGLCIMELTECRNAKYADNMEKIGNNMLFNSKGTYHDFIMSVQNTVDVYKKTFTNNNAEKAKPAFMLFGTAKSSGACIEMTCWVARALYVIRRTKDFKKVVSSLIMMYCKYREYLTGKLRSQYKNNTYVMCFLLDIFTAYIHYCSPSKECVTEAMNSSVAINEIQKRVKQNIDGCNVYDVITICVEIYQTIMDGCIATGKDGSVNINCWGKRLMLSKSESEGTKDNAGDNSGIEFLTEPSLYNGTIAHTSLALIACKDFFSELMLLLGTDETRSFFSDSYDINGRIPLIRRWLLNKYKEDNNFPNCNEYIVSHNVLCNKDGELEFCDIKHNSEGDNCDERNKCDKDFDLLEERHFSHYTVALMLRALIYCNLTIDDNPIAELVEQLYTDLDINSGLWSEDGTPQGVRYIYRTYEAIVAINTLAFDSLSIPMHKYAKKNGINFDGASLNEKESED